MRELALFAGAGGGILGGLLLGWRTVCAVELDPYCRSVLLARQRDGFLHRFPIWDDIRTFDGKPWNGSIDVVSGGFPCQDISSAGRRAGITGARSGLWAEMARVVGEVRPRFVFVENSQHLTSHGLGRVLGDLAGLGYDARWGVLGACCIGAPHVRKRIWIVAHSMRFGGGSRRKGTVSDESQQSLFIGADARSDASDADNGRQRKLSVDAQVGCASATGKPDEQNTTDAWWSVDLLSGMDDGMANRVDRVAAIGNGQVPAVVRLAWETLNRWRW